MCMGTEIQSQGANIAGTEKLACFIEKQNNNKHGEKRIHGNETTT